MTHLSEELQQRLSALRARKGGIGPHMDRANATLDQLAKWADDAARNVGNTWKYGGSLAHLGGWEASFLRHLAGELRGIAEIVALLPDPDLEAAQRIADKWESSFVTPFPPARRASLEKALLEAMQHARTQAKE